MGALVYAVLAAVAGTGQPVQAAMNAQLKKHLASPTLASCVQFVVAAVLLGACAGAGLLGRGTFENAKHAPWWAWCGGVIGAVSVTVNLIAISRVAATTTIGAALVGQLIAAAIVDHFGWLSVERVPLNGYRIGGMVLLLGGIILVQRR